MKIQWEYDLVEKPCCEQLRVIGWQWIEGDTDVSKLTERETFRKVLLKGRLTATLRKLNLRDGQPWLDDVRITRAIRDLEQAAGLRLMEVNQAATELLLKGTVADGLSEWDYGRPQPVKFIDFENPTNNDFLVINQFKVELTSTRGHVIPDAVLFVNGIPMVVVEFKSPGIQNLLQEAINQLLRYSNQRQLQSPFFDLVHLATHCHSPFFHRATAHASTLMSSAGVWLSASKRILMAEVSQRSLAVSHTP